MINHEERKNEILEKLSNNSSLGYLELFHMLDSVRSDRTYRKLLKELKKEGSIGRRESKQDKRSVEYYFRGIKLEQVLKKFRKEDKKLEVLQKELQKMISYYITLKKIEKKRKRKRRSLLGRLPSLITRQFSTLVGFIFQNSHLVLFLEISRNYSLYKEAEKKQEKQISKLIGSMGLLKNEDYEMYEKIINLQLKTNIKI